LKLSTTREAFFADLQSVTRVASTHTAVQALSGVQLAAAAGALELRATDLEVGLRVPVAAEVERDGEAVLPARLLLDVVRATRQQPSGEIVDAIFRAVKEFRGDTAPNDDMTAVAVRITNEGLKADGSGVIRTGRSG